jgi:Fur family iron response transcriptional regulator
VYNTLNLFVEKGLLRELIIEEGHVVFDPRLDAHHHFVDVKSGQIFDLPVGAVSLGPLTGLDDFVVEEVQVVVRGTRREAPVVSVCPDSQPSRRRAARTRSRFGRRPGTHEQKN